MTTAMEWDFSSTQLPAGHADAEGTLSWKWFCEPPRWEIDASRRCLRVVPAARSDFWQRTYYPSHNFDNGHFCHTEIAGDFILTAHVLFHPRHQYDQAGLCIRVGPDCWLKTSVEYEALHIPSRLGAVATNFGYSDWSTQDFDNTKTSLWIRVRRQGRDFIVEAADGSATDACACKWSQLRIAHLHGLAADDAPVMAGVYAVSPIEAGFSAEFDFISVQRGRLAVSAHI